MSGPSKRSVEGQKRRRDQQALRKKAIVSASRDVGPLPAVKDPARRERARLSFRTFAKVYFPSSFDRPWSPDHFKVIDKTERAVLSGSLFAMAMPRGSGKTTIAECACLWAGLFGHRQFIVLIGADIGSATYMLDSLKTELETNELLAEDFPEVCHLVQKLEGIAHRAGGQLLDGQPTRLGWTADELIFPTIEGKPSSGVIIRVAGITGRIRGMKYKRADGGSVRPDFVVVDDPQTDESARSVSQSQAREAVLSGAILGLAGPGKKIAGIMPCTVIRPGDMADRILDQQRHPEWNGERTKLVYAWPTASALWEEYARRRADSLRADGTIAAATEFYRANRAAMDAGSQVAWESRFNTDELSAIQHAWNIRLTDEAAFFAEYQNEPLPDQQFTDDGLTGEYVASRLAGTPRGAVPPWATRLTGFIDVQGTTLWWVISAWGDDCTGQVIDYGTWPDQKRAYFTLRDAKVTIASVITGAGLEGQIFGALKALADELLATGRYKVPDGSALPVERLLVDANWGESTATVYEFCRQSPHAAVLMPSHGKYIGASTRPMSEWKKEKGERMGHGWKMSATKRRVRHVTYDTNLWKSWIATRLLTAVGDPGALTLFGRDPERHRMIGDHCASEHRTRTTGRGRTVDEWKVKPGQDNHLWDGVVGCAVGASMQGMPVAPAARDGTPGPAGAGALGGGKGNRMSFAALQRAAKQKRPA